MKPRVSIAIPTYNQAQFIRQAVQSALAQDYPNLEVVVADDASTDVQAQAVLGEFQPDERLRIVRNDHNLGRVGNYRRVLHEHMTGDWALMLDGDDFLLDRSYVSKAIEQIQRDDQVVLAFGGCRMMSENRYRDHIQPPLRGAENFTADGAWQIIDGRDYFLQWGVWLGVPHQSALYRRSLALQLDFYQHNIISSDWESLRRLILHGKVLIYRKAVAVWRRHAVGASNDVRDTARIADLQSITQPCDYAQRFQFSDAALGRWRHDTLVDYASDTYRVALNQGKPTSMEALLVAMEPLDRAATQRARRVIRYSPGFIIKRFLLRVLGGELYLSLMRRIQSLTWARITA